MRTFAATVALALGAGMASAEGYTIHDFGVTVTREACMAQANEVLSAYLQTYGGWEVTPTEWVVYAWDLAPGDQDVAIMCPVLPDGSFYSFMVVYGETDSDAERQNTADIIDAMWWGEAPPAPRPPTKG